MIQSGLVCFLWAWLGGRVCGTARVRSVTFALGVLLVTAGTIFAAASRVLLAAIAGLGGCAGGKCQHAGEGEKQVFHRVYVGFR